MQTTKYLYRLYCKKCSDYTIHSEKDGEYTCECGSIHEHYKLSEVDPEKVKEQRNRFKAYRSNERNETLSHCLGYLDGSNKMKEMMNMFSAPGSNIKTIIKESDAGLKREEKIINDKIDEEIRILKEERLKFKDVGRNDICLCGSGKKYKKCCYNKLY